MNVEVKRASHVDAVVNKIEELSPSPNDEEIRWKTYYVIYRDPFLSRYAPGGAMLWGHRHRFGGFNGLWGDGMEPAGNYPIHIIVRGGRVSLMGVVDDPGDRTIAEINERLPRGATVDFLNPMSTPETFAELQALGHLRGDLKLGLADLDRFCLAARVDVGADIVG